MRFIFSAILALFLTAGYSQSDCLIVIPTRGTDSVVINTNQILYAVQAPSGSTANIVIADFSNVQTRITLDSLISLLPDLIKFTDSQNNYPTGINKQQIREIKRSSTNKAVIFVEWNKQLRYTSTQSYSSIRSLADACNSGSSEPDGPTGIYGGSDTIPSGTAASLVDSFMIRKGGETFFKVGQNGAMYSRYTGAYTSMIISSTTDEDYSNSTAGYITIVGTTSDEDTTTGVRRNAYDSSAFFGQNRVEGGAVFFDYVAGYGNWVKGQNPKNIVSGVRNIVSGSDNTITGYSNTATGSLANVHGQGNTISGANSGAFGAALNVSQANTFSYGVSSQPTRHGFGTAAPAARMQLVKITGVPTLLMDGEARLSEYGSGNKSASALSKTTTGRVAVFATDGTFLDDGPRIFTGTGAPESVVTAPVGSLYTRTDGGANTTLYVKESGTGNTGWVAK